MSGWIHCPLLKISTALANCDFALFSLAADDFRHLPLHAFYPGQHYGGTLLSYFRAFWHTLGGADAVFSFQITPALMTLATFYMLTAGVRRRTTLIFTTLSAVGFSFWISQLGNDFYILLYLGTCVLLGLRMRGPQNPLFQLSDRTLLGWGALWGFMTYSHRAALIYGLALWIQPHWIKKGWGYLKAGRPTILRFAAWLLLGLFWVLELNGPEVGHWRGRAIRLHAGPNFNWAAILIGIIALYDLYQRKRVTAWMRRGFWVGLGFVLGLMPEWLSAWQEGRGLSGHGAQVQSFPDVFATFLKTPLTWIELVGASPDSTTPVILSTLFAIGLAYVLFDFIINGINKPKSLTLIFAIFLCFWAFLRVKTYAIAPVRYLFPIFPALILAWAVQFERQRITQGLVCLFLLVHGWSLISIPNSPRLLSEQGQVFKTISVFENLGVHWVLTENFWWTHQYTLATNSKIRFLPPKGMIPDSMIRDWQNFLSSSDSYQKPVGFLGPISQSPNFETHQARWKPIPLATPGHYLLLRK